jgi:hypothetical protein
MKILNKKLGIFKTINQINPKSYIINNYSFNYSTFIKSIKYLDHPNQTNKFKFSTASNQ